MKQDIKKTKIIVSRTNLQKLIEMYQVSRSTVYYALSYNSMSDVAKAIRKDALEMGGHKYTFHYAD